MTGRLERTVRVRCPVAQAFAAFTGHIDLWWPRTHRRFDRSEMRLEARAGGRFFERTPAGEEAQLGEVLACDPPNRIRYSWYPGSMGIPTEVEVRFTAEGSLTRVDVVHAEADSGLGAVWADRAVLFERGWGLILPAFTAYAERPGNPAKPHAAFAAPAPGKGSTT